MAIKLCDYVYRGDVYSSPNRIWTKREGGPSLFPSAQIWAKGHSAITKSLKTYREDVYRTLNALIEKGMVHPSLGVPTFYVAVELETALESVLKKQESELREMEVRKQELGDLSTHQRFSPSNQVTTFKIIKSLGELVSVTIPPINSAQEELLIIVPHES